MAKGSTIEHKHIDLSGWWAGLIVLAGFALRLYRIGYQSIWWDEAHTLYVAREGLRAVWDLPNTVSYNHPPLHYGFMVLWTRLAGVGEVAARLPSALFGVLLIALVYAVTRRWFDRASGLAAAALAAVWPIFITYSQEVRVYALLPVLYLAMVYLAYRIVERGQETPWDWWALLAVVELAALLSHYFMALGVLYLNGVLLAARLRGRGVSMRAWIVSQIVVAAIFGGWAARLIPNLTFLQADLNVAGPAARLWPVARRIGLFVFAGYPAADDPGGWLALVVGVAAGLSTLAVMAALASRPRGPLGRTLIDGLAGLALALVIFWRAPQSQPRYLIGFTIPLVVALAAACVTLLRAKGWRRALGGATALALAALCVSGWAEATFDPATFKADARGAAAFLEGTAEAGDVIFASPNDHSIAYYYAGPAAIQYTSDQGVEAQAAQLWLAAQPGHRVFLADWEPSTADPVGLRAYLLERAGRLEQVADLHGYDVFQYTIAEPVGGLPELTATDQAAGPVALTGYQVDGEATNDGALTASFGWRWLGTAAGTYRASVRLLDASGAVVSAADATLPAADTMVQTFHVVPVPLGTLPGEYRLSLRVYDAGTGEPGAWADGAVDWMLPEAVTVTEGSDFAHDPYGTRTGIAWQAVDPPLEAGDWQLTQVGFEPGQGLPGQPITALLWWETPGGGQADGLPSVELVDGNQVWSAAEYSGGYLPVLASDGAIVERRTLTYPPLRGPLTLQANDEPLAKVGLNVEGLTWNLPRMNRRIGVDFGGIGMLAGADVPDGRIAAGEAFAVTLYWQVENDSPVERPYTVFVQLLAADGRLIAQHDGPPAVGSRPTTSWIGGEVIADAHQMTWQDVSYSGPARLIVGLYDSETITRVGTADGADYVELTEIRVVSNE